MSLSKSRLYSGILLALSIVFGLLATKLKIALLGFAVSSILLLTLVIYYLDTCNRDEDSILPLHLFALHILLFTATRLLWGVDGTLFTRWLHAFTDALAVISLLKLMKVNNIINGLVALVIFGLTLVNLQIGAQVIFCFIAVVSLITVVRNRDEIADIGYLLVLGFAFVFDRLLNISDVNYYFHFLLSIFSLVIAISFLRDSNKKEVSKNGSFDVDELDGRELKNSPINTTNIDVEEIDLQPISFDRSSWITPEFANKSLADLLDSPLYALEGLSDDTNHKLYESLQIETIRDLAENKYFKVAEEIVKRALQ